MGTNPKGIESETCPLLKQLFNCSRTARKESVCVNNRWTTSVRGTGKKRSSFRKGLFCILVDNGCARKQRFVVGLGREMRLMVEKWNRRQKFLVTGLRWDRKSLIELEERERMD